MKRLVLAAALLSLPLCAFGAPSASLRMQAGPKEIHIGDPVEVRITVVHSTDIAPSVAAIPTTMGEFELMGSTDAPGTIAATKPSKARGGRVSSTLRFYVTTFSTGPVILPAIPIQFQKADGTLLEARTEPLSITVKSLLQEKGDEGHLRPAKGPFNYRSWTWLWILIAILFVLLTVSVWPRRGDKPAAGPPAPLYSPEEEASRALSELQAADLVSQGQIQEFYFRLSSILRRYIERRYGIPAPEMTSSEIVSSFGRIGLPLEASFACREFLDEADLVKFAKMEPDPGDIPVDVARVKLFIQVTTPVEEKPEEKKNGEKEEAIPV
ncbi:MAG: hypothetical protein JO102_04450 [Elusimicrobia bacterium]|nr:hypothetical protein [Elusimicrobiota bacterium]